GTNGFALNGSADNDDAGSAVSGAGDINADGFDDLIIGAPEADAGGVDGGQSYVVFGKSGGFAASLNLSSLDGTNGFTLNGIGDQDGSGYLGSGGGADKDERFGG